MQQSTSVGRRRDGGGGELEPYSPGCVWLVMDDERRDASQAGRVARDTRSRPTLRLTLTERRAVMTVVGVTSLQSYRGDEGWLHLGEPIVIADA